MGMYMYMHMHIPMQVYLVIRTLSRFLMVLMDALNWKTTAVSTLLIINLRLEILIELLLCSTLEQVSLFSISMCSATSCVLCAWVL